MNRRAFLRDAASTLLVLPFGTFLVHCGSDDDKQTVGPVQPDNAPPQAEPKMVDGNVAYTSNKVLGHSHTFPVSLEALGDPPADGVSGDTSTSQGHDHAMVVTQDALRMAAGGQAVKIQSATTQGHSHTFTIVKI